MAKTYNTVPDKAANDVFTESMWDDSLRMNINNLIVPAACSVRKSGTQSIPHDSSTAVTFDVEDFDTDTMHDNAVNQSRITINTAGIYIISGLVGFAPTAGGGVREASIRKNGASTYLSLAKYVALTSTENFVQVAVIANLAVNDYVELYAYQSSGGAINTDSLNLSRLAAIWIGRTS
jgi:hypothetical protein